MSDDEPMFHSVDEMCAAFGWDETTKQQILRDLELTARAVGDVEAEAEIYRHGVGKCLH